MHMVVTEKSRPPVPSSCPEPFLLIQRQKRRHEFQMKEEQLIRTTETELKHIREFMNVYSLAGTIQNTLKRPSQPQRVILQEIQNLPNGESFNENSIRIHYMTQHSQLPIHVFTRLDSRSSSPGLVDQSQGNIAAEDANNEVENELEDTKKRKLKA
ncbi:hypothetical protein ILUMI_22270 [Ignelater luminosus]|uniref:Uncharacterized protein n=1 Tax=Ignelater luminosus TaxID=2038154 RepID=A0A8K0CHE2_IGNLU|nr:hypothetical protein ILUMI_22270 [Ignelater luminosus]